MNLATFYDFETSGLPLFKEPSSDPRQPHIVELAGIQVDLDTKETINTVEAIIKPNGWEIPQEVISIHGITVEQAMDTGIDEKEAVSMLLEMIGSNVRIGHNESFDARIMRIAVKRYFDDMRADVWKAGLAECTAKLSRSNFNKMPTLTEAYRHYYGIDFVNPHRAMSDAKACRDVYFAIKGMELKAAA
jgi:DNA polymerase-3 subunit epsilon